MNLFGVPDTLDGLNSVANLAITLRGALEDVVDVADLVRCWEAQPKEED